MSPSPSAPALPAGGWLVTEAADQRMVIRSDGDDLAGFVHDVSHAHPTFGGSRATALIWIMVRRL
jgi:hypothetical protein